MSKLTKSTNPSDGFKTGAGAQLGQKAKAILNALRNNGRKNRLDLEMMIGPQLSETIRRMERLGFVSVRRNGNAAGCYEITNQGRIALGEALSIPAPAVSIICNATMPRDSRYDPSVHNTSRIGLAMA